VAVSLGKSLYILRQRDHKKCEHIFSTSITSHKWVVPVTKETPNATLVVGEESGAVSLVTLNNVRTVVDLDSTVAPMMDNLDGKILCMIASKSVVFYYVLKHYITWEVPLILLLTQYSVSYNVM